MFTLLSIFDHLQMATRVTERMLSPHTNYRKNLVTLVSPLLCPSQESGTSVVSESVWLCSCHDNHAVVSHLIPGPEKLLKETRIYGKSIPFPPLLILPPIFFHLSNSTKHIIPPFSPGTSETVASFLTAQHNFVPSPLSSL